MVIEEIHDNTLPILLPGLRWGLLQYTVQTMNNKTPKVIQEPLTSALPEMKLQEG